MTKYLLPCSCGERTAVELTQAGQEVVCACGRAQIVPTLRELRRLPPAPEQGPPSAPSWSVQQGALFASGLVIVAAALLFAGFQLRQRASLATEDTMQRDDVIGSAIIEALTAEGAYEAWKQLSEVGLGERVVPEFMLAREESRRLLIQVWVALGFAAVGAAVAGYAVISGKRP